jgi:hypothetical protein
MTDTQAAGFLGMSVEVLLDTYGHHHPEFLPEFLRDAPPAITSKPKQNNVSGVISGVDLAAVKKAEKRCDFLVGVAGFEPATPASRTQCTYPKSLKFIAIAKAIVLFCSRPFRSIHCEITAMFFSPSEWPNPGRTIRDHKQRSLPLSIRH